MVGVLLCRDSFVTMLVLYYVVEAPIQIAFEDHAAASIPWFDVFGDLAFIVDIIQNFFTAFRDEGELITNRRRIRNRYLLSWFIVDAVSSIPFSWFGNGDSQYQIVKILRLFKLVRMVKMSQMFRKVERRYT